MRWHQLWATRLRAGAIAAISAALVFGVTAPGHAAQSTAPPPMSKVSVVTPSTATVEAITHKLQSAGVLARTHLSSLGITPIGILQAVEISNRQPGVAGVGQHQRIVLAFGSQALTDDLFWDGTSDTMIQVIGFLPTSAGTNGRSAPGALRLVYHYTGSAIEISAQGPGGFQRSSRVASPAVTCKAVSCAVASGAVGAGAAIACEGSTLGFGTVFCAFAAAAAGAGAEVACDQWFPECGNSVPPAATIERADCAVEYQFAPKSCEVSGHFGEFGWVPSGFYLEIDWISATVGGVWEFSWCAETPPNGPGGCNYWSALSGLNVGATPEDYAYSAGIISTQGDCSPSWVAHTIVEVTFTRIDDGMQETWTADSASPVRCP